MLAAWTDTCQALGSTVGAVGVVAAIVYAARQTGSLREQVQLQREEQTRLRTAVHAGQYMNLLERVLEADRLFVEHPELRPYFYDSRPLPDDGTLRDQVVATAEYLLDLADMVGNQRRHGQLDDADYRSWREAFRGYYASSPAVRALWSAWRDIYPAETALLLEPADGEAAGMDLALPAEG